MLPGRSLFLIASFALLACRKERTEPVVADKPSPMKAPSASKSVAPPGPTPSDTQHLEGDFDRFDSTGGTFSVLVPSSSKPEKIVVLDAATFAEKARRSLDPTSIAFTYGGAFQVVSDGKTLTRVEVDTAKRTKIPITLVAPDGDQPGTLSDDGRLFTYGDLTIFDLDKLAIAYTFEPPCAGGPIPVAGVEPSGHFATGVCRGTARLKLGAPGTDLPWGYRVGRYAVSADERTFLDGPYMPFAMDWVPDFVVREGATGKDIVKLPFTLAPKPGEYSAEYAMALSNKGDVAAILADETLTLFRTSDGKKLTSKKGPKVEGTTIAFDPRGRALWIIHDKTVQIDRGF